MPRFPQWSIALKKKRKNSVIIETLLLLLLIIIIIITLININISNSSDSIGVGVDSVVRLRTRVRAHRRNVAGARSSSMSMPPALPAAAAAPWHAGASAAALAVMQTVLVVDGTAAMSMDFPAMLEACVEPVLRELSAIAAAGRVAPTATMYGLVVFGQLGPHSDRAVYVHDFTSDMADFSRRLHAIRFSGGGCMQTAAADGLGAALQLMREAVASPLHAEGRQVLRQVIMVTNTIPSMTGCRWATDHVGKTCLELASEFSKVRSPGRLSIAPPAAVRRYGRGCRLSHCASHAPWTVFDLPVGSGAPLAAPSA